MLEGIEANGEISQEAKDKVNELLKHSFRPEFLNRLDEIVMFKPLSKDNVTAIVDLIIADLNKRLKDKELSCVVTEDAKKFIVFTTINVTTIIIVATTAAPCQSPNVIVF